MTDDTKLLDSNYQAEENMEDLDSSREKAGNNFQFSNFSWKPWLSKAIIDCGLEQPSKVQQVCIPQAMLGNDILCQFKSGIERATVYILATLQQLVPIQNQIHVLVLCPTRELTLQVSEEYHKLSKYMPSIRILACYGELPIAEHVKSLKTDNPHILVGTPDRIWDLMNLKAFSPHHLKFFILDECDQMLNKLDSRADIQDIFCITPYEKQVMMFGSALSEGVRTLCKKFMYNAKEICVNDETHLVPQDVRQFYVKLQENEKNQILTDLLRGVHFKQTVIFVRSVARCVALTSLLQELGFSVLQIHSSMLPQERYSVYKEFKQLNEKILVATDVFVRLQMPEVNFVLNYDVPTDASTYLNRAAFANNIGKKGLVVTFVSFEEDADRIMNEFGDKFGSSMEELAQDISNLEI